jgi:hypothetical protein
MPGNAATAKRGEKRKRSSAPDLIQPPSTDENEEPDGAQDGEDPEQPLGAAKRARVVGPGDGDAEGAGSGAGAVDVVASKRVTLADMEDAVAQGLSCSICTLILCECVSIWPCLHSFCGGCLSQWCFDGEKTVSESISILINLTSANETAGSFSFLIQTWTFSLKLPAIFVVKGPADSI